MGERAKVNKQSLANRSFHKAPLLAPFSSPHSLQVRMPSLVWHLPAVAQALSYCPGSCAHLQGALHK